MECDVCGGEHDTEVCPELGLGEAAAQPAQSLTKARLTVPSNLIHAIAEGQNGVYTREVLQVKTQFGPFEARRTTHEIANDDLFVLKVLSKDKDGGAICLDTTDENECNWMCLVGVAISEDEQNCMAYQLGTNIFYNTTKEVETGHALKVWYSPHYARKLGRSEKPDGITKSMLGYIIQMSEDSFPTPTPTPTPEVSKVGTGSSPAPQQSRRFLDGSGDTANVFSDEKEPLWNDRNSDDNNEGSFMESSGIYMFKCQRCNQAFEDQSELAYHIREHIMPTVEKRKSTALYMCKVCKVGFQTVSNYNRHMKRHVGYKVKCPQCNYFTYRGDILQTHLIGQHGATLEEAKGLAAKAEIPGSQDREPDGRRGRRKRPGRKRKAIPQDDFNDDEDDDDDVDEADEAVEDAAAESVEQEDETSETTLNMLKDEVSTKEEGEVTRDDTEEVLHTGLVSPTRVQPRRSLKGIRTTGALKGIKPVTLFKREKIDSDSEGEQSPLIAATPVVVPSTGRKRGRPRKVSLPEVQLVEPATAGVDPPKKKRGRPRKDANVVKPAEKENVDDEVTELGEIAECSIKVEHQDEQNAKLAVGDETCEDSAKADNGVKGCAVLNDVAVGDTSVPDVAVLDTSMPDVAVGDTASMPDVAVGDTASMPDVAVEDTSVPDVAVGDTASMPDVAVEDTSVPDVAVGDTSVPDVAVEDTSMPDVPVKDNCGSHVIGSETSVTATETSVAVESFENTGEGMSEDATGNAEDTAAILSKSPADVVHEDAIERQDMAENKETATLECEDNDSDDADYVAPKLPRRRGRPPKHGRHRASELLDLQKHIRKVGNAFQCCVCEKKFSQRKYLLLHLPKHTSKFKCSGCEKQFARHESYLNHTCTHHSVSDDIITTEKNGCYSCGECGKIFAKPEHVKRHYSVHLSTWKCEKCNKKFSRRHLLLDHVCLGENGEEIFDNHECEICKQCFRSLKYLFRHMAMHTDIFKCKGCDKTFSRKDSLQRHVLRCSPDMADDYKIYDCKNCKKTFSTKLGLENHYLHCANYSCPKCRVAFFELEHLEKHKCDGKVVHESASIQFPCQECGKTFASINYLRRHEDSHKGAFTCSMCEKSFSRKEEQKLHEHFCYALNQLETNAEVECANCSNKFTDAKAYRDHQHKHSHPFKCEKCCKRFIKIGTLTTHTCAENIAEEDSPYACTVCSRTFRSATYLARHQTIHEKPQFECEYCHKPFYRKDYLNNHVCKMPDGPVVRIVRKRGRIFIKENLVCHLCGRTFVSSSNLNKHMKIHGEKQNTCPHCGKKFHYPTYLREHIKTVHQKAYQFQCADCGKILHSKTGLSAHIKQFHSNQIQLYQCGTCQKTFRQKGNLKTHMYSHTKEKTFMCEFCNKMFKYPDQLNRHRLEHTMTTKLSCEYCDKKFCRSYQLKKHLQTFHSGVVYVCDICNERCSHKHTIVRHYKRKHPEVSSVFDHPNFVSQLQQDPVDSEVQLDVKPSISSIVQAIDQVETTVETTDVGIGEQQVYTVAEIQGDGNTYHHLANTIIASDVDGGTLTIPSSIEGADGQQTVVILQIVNPEDEDGMQGIEDIQEVQEIMYTEEAS